MIFFHDKTLLYVVLVNVLFCTGALYRCCFLHSVSRTNDRTAPEITADDDVTARGACGGRAKSCDPGDGEGVRAPWSREEKDPERYLHRIRH